MCGGVGRIIVERVIFYDEYSGERIDALLNPETLTWWRRAGLRPRALDELPIGTTDQIDDTLIYTGGGETEIALELLFDTRLLTGIEGVQQQMDVRRLTAPLWALAEGRSSSVVATLPRAQRLIWSEWSVLVVVVALAERFEDFTSDGIPR